MEIRTDVVCKSFFINNRRFHHYAMRFFFKEKHLLKKIAFQTIKMKKQISLINNSVSEELEISSKKQIFMDFIH